MLKKLLTLLAIAVVFEGCSKTPQVPGENGSKRDSTAAANARAPSQSQSAGPPPAGVHGQPDPEITTRTQTALRRAQQLKLDNQFDAARREFEALGLLSEPGTENFAGLATDELRYGLPLHEANYWLLRVSGTSDTRKVAEFQARAEQLYREILKQNASDPERMRNIQQRLDQLYVSRNAYARSNQANAFAKLTELRNYLNVHFANRGEWPDQRTLAAELVKILNGAALPTDRYLIKNYWSSKDGYYLLLRDGEGGPPITIKGDGYGSKIEVGEK